MKEGSEELELLLEEFEERESTLEGVMQVAPGALVDASLGALGGRVGDVGLCGKQWGLGIRRIWSNMVQTFWV